MGYRSDWQIAVEPETLTDQVRDKLSSEHQMFKYDVFESDRKFYEYSVIAEISKELGCKITLTRYTEAPYIYVYVADRGEFTESHGKIVACEEQEYNKNGSYF